jgi:tripartite-type tricarboxylate transporter receptor subunit TctC
VDKMIAPTLAIRLTVVASVATATSPVLAQNLETYNGRTLQVVIGYATGSPYDVYARVFIRHLGKHLGKDVKFVPQNMPGAGSLRATNYLFNVVSRDGSVFGVVGRGMPFEPLFGNDAAKFDAFKFNWLGSISDEVSVCASWHTSGVNTFDDVRKKELIIGSSGAGGDSYVFPNVLNTVLGSKFKIVTGYAGGAEVQLAMERGELEGRCGWSWSALKTQAGHLIEEKTRRLNILIQVALRKHPDLPNVPSVMDIADTDQQKLLLTTVFARQSIAYPIVAPPGVPAGQVAALRRAFDATMRDSEFLADALKSHVDVRPTTGEDVLRLVKSVYQAPAEVVAAAKEASGVRKR